VDEGRFVDMIEIDAASRTGVDDMRELLEAVQYTPTRGRYKVYIIDEVHMLSTSSFNALLKTLEEPPPHVKFVLATTDPQKIPVTILSRCLQFNLRRLLPDQVAGYLKKLIDAEDIEAEPETLTVLARAADGSMRDGLSLLDQAIAFGGGRLLMSDLEKMLGLVDHRHVISMIGALADDDAGGLLAIVGELVAQSRDLGTALTNLAEILHRVTLVQCVPGYRDPERSDWEAIEELAGRLPAEDAQLFYQIAIKGRNELALAPDPRTGLEMTLLRMLAFRPAAAAPVKPPAGGTPSKTRPGTASRTASKASAGKAAQSATKQPEPAPAPAAAGADKAEKPGAAGGDWVDLLDQLELSGQARELARNVQLKARDDDRWEFVIAPALRHLGSAACVDRLSEAISDRMGHPVRVLITDQADSEPLTAAALEQQRLHRNRSEAEKAIRDDPTVRALQEQMGAELIEDSIQPLQ
jgi:DNA polymerase-3 subunit gamma/tau